MASPPNIVSLVDLLDRSAEKYGPRELFGTKTGSSWVYTTYAQFKKLVEDMRGGLATLGIILPHDAREGAYRRYTGDTSVIGKGEILVWSPRKS